jgi:hypothetical protein
MYNQEQAVSELSIWKKINSCKTVEDLKQTILDTWGDNGVIDGRTNQFSVPEMIYMIDRFEEDWQAGSEIFRSLPTRNYGIRQQLIYILKNPKR